MIISWLCQLLSCNFASLCVLAASAICSFSIRESFSTAHSTATLFFSATLQNFCCRITETFFSRLCVIHFPISISFACVQYHRLNACMQALLQRNYLQLQTISSKKIITTPQRHHLSSSCCFCFACQLSRTYPRLFLEGGHSYIVDTLVL